MSGNYLIRLSTVDVMQLLDALKLRAQIWENTVKYSKGELMADMINGIEEYSNIKEAEEILGHYKSIIDSVNYQMDHQVL